MSSASVENPTVTCPRTTKIDTPKPMSPARGTQPISPSTLAPARYTGCRGPGTLVTTPAALLPKNEIPRSSITFGAAPSPARTPKATSASGEPLIASTRRCISASRSRGGMAPVGRSTK